MSAAELHSEAYGHDELRCASEHVPSAGRTQVIRMAYVPQLDRIFAGKLVDYRMIHTIKIMESFAEAVFRGEKTFEVRKNDRGYQRGDYVQFKVLYDSDGLEMLDHPLSKQTYEITYVLNGWGLQDGYVVFGIRKVP